MSVSKPRVFRYSVLFLVMFISLTTVVQLVAYEAGIEPGTGIVMSGFLAAACGSAMLFVYDHGRGADGWESRLMALACMVLFSFFELGVGYVLLQSDGYEELLKEIKGADALSLSLAFIGIMLCLYLVLLVVFIWGTRLYVRFFFKDKPAG